MDISPKTVSFLNLKGYPSKRLNELNLQKASDEEVINFASQENWIIITIDLDYPEIIALSRKKSPLAVIFRIDNPEVNILNSLLQEHLEEIIDDLNNGAIATIEADRIRIHPLPIEI